MHEVLVNRLGGLSLPRKSVVRLTDRPDMTLDVYRGRKTINQQQILRIKNGMSFYYFIGSKFMTWLYTFCQCRLVCSSVRSSTKRQRFVSDLSLKPIIIVASYFVHDISIEKFVRKH